MTLMSNAPRIELFRLAVEQERHRRLDGAPRVGAECRKSRRVVFVGNRHPVPAFAQRVADDDVESLRARGMGTDEDAALAHRMILFVAGRTRPPLLT